MAIKRYVLTFLLLLMTVTACAVNVILPETPLTGHDFNTALATKSLEKFSNKTNLQTADIHELRAAVTELNAFELQAKKCIDENTAALTLIDKNLAPVNSSSLSADQKYITKKKTDLTNQLSDCRLFLLRADEVISNLNVQLRTVVKNRLIYQEPDIITNIKHIFTDVNDFYKMFDFWLFIQLSGLSLFGSAQLIILAILLGLSIALGMQLRRLIIKQLNPNPPLTFVAKFKQTLACVLRRYLPVLLPIAVFVLFITSISPSWQKLPTLALGSFALGLYIVFLLLSSFFFYPPKPALAFSDLPAPTRKQLVRRLKLIGLLGLCSYWIFLAFIEQAIPIALISLLKTLFITILAINLIAIIWLVKRLPKIRYHYHTLGFLTSIFFSVMLLSILGAEWLGYHLLAIYLLHGIITTAIAAFITRLIFKLSTIGFTSLNRSDFKWQQNFQKRFGLKRNERLLELVWLRALVYSIIWCSFLLFLLKTWGIAETSFQLLLTALIHGFQIGEFTIVPLHIVLGVLFFSLLAATTRIVRTSIMKNADIEFAKGNRDSLASIVGYIGFGIAFLLGLLIAGVNFSGLALIAGALSVGIGFGLQSIVNNFVSGIILLVERPIKPGDRIIVGDTEGYVRKISIRSTQLITTLRSDIIVPNSDLTSKQVTNYMLYDTNFKISTSVGIAYGSDTELAKNLLLEIARTHPQVITDKPDLIPQVYFRTFGDNSLNFELYCVIKDVDLKVQVVSDLNFAIDKLFKAKGINIAFPQREITVKNWPAPPAALLQPPE